MSERSVTTYTYTCDRCGKRQIENNRPNNWAYFRVSTPSIRHNMPVEGDLCSDCDKELRNWYNRK